MTIPEIIVEVALNRHKPGYVWCTVDENETPRFLWGDVSLNDKPEYLRHAIIQLGQTLEDVLWKKYETEVRDERA